MSDIINVHTANLVDLQKIHKICPKKAEKKSLKHVEKIVVG